MFQEAGNRSDPPRLTRTCARLLQLALSPHPGGGNCHFRQYPVPRSAATLKVFHSDVTMAVQTEEQA